MNPRAPFLLVALLTVLLAGRPVGFIRAQDLSTPLVLDEDVTGEVSLVTLEPAFVFTNEAAQSVQIMVFAITPGFTPALRVENPDGETIADISNPGGIDRLQTIVLLAAEGD